MPDMNFCLIEIFTDYKYFRLFYACSRIGAKKTNIAKNPMQNLKDKSFLNKFLDNSQYAHIGYCLQ